MRLNRTLASAMAAALLLTSISISKAEARTVPVASMATLGVRADDSSSKHQMSAKDLKERLEKGEKIVIIDARGSLNGQIIKGALHIPEDKLKAWTDTADKSSVIVTYCTCPHDEAAESEVEILLKLGFQNSYSLTGGLNAARTAGIDVVVPKDE